MLFSYWKLRLILTRLRKFSQKSNWRSSETCSWVPYLRKWFSRDLMNTFRFSNSNMTLMHFLTLNFQSLRILIFENQARTPDIEEKHDNGNINNMATYIAERLEGKFVSSNAIDLSRRHLSESEICLLSRVLSLFLQSTKLTERS